MSNATLNTADMANIFAQAFVPTDVTWQIFLMLITVIGLVMYPIFGSSLLNGKKSK